VLVKREGVEPLLIENEISLKLLVLFGNYLKKFTIHLLDYSRIRLISFNFYFCVYLGNKAL
jgi:hypothetical protein